MSVEVPLHSIENPSLAEKEITVNLKSASFLPIMLLHKCLTRIQSQIKPKLVQEKYKYITLLLISSSS